MPTTGSSPTEALAKALKQVFPSPMSFQAATDEWAAGRAARLETALTAADYSLVRTDELEGLRDRDRLAAGSTEVRCTECGRRGYRTWVGTHLAVGHLDQRVKHSFRLSPTPEPKENR